MYNDRIRVAIYGTFQDGKSTLINCLTNSDMAEVGGAGVSVTHINTRYIFGSSSKIFVVNEQGTRREISKLQYLSTKDSIVAKEIIIESKSPVLKYFDIIDTPGFDANESDSKIAQSLLKNTDFAILLLRNKGISEQNKCIAKQLMRYNIPYTCVINCFYEILDNWNPCAEQNENIKKDILAELKMISCNPISKLKVEPVYVVNLMWFWLSLGLKSQNSSIQLSKKIVRKFWSELIGNSDYSTARLKHASKAESFLRIFKTKDLRTFLIALKGVKESHHLCRTSMFSNDYDLKKMKSNVVSSICDENNFREEKNKLRTMFKSI